MAVRRRDRFDEVRGSGYVLQCDEGLGGDAAQKASGPSTGGSVTVIESDADGGAPPHVHTREDEAMYVLEGEIVARVADAQLRATSGGFVFMPRGMQHDWGVVGSRAPVLIITSPVGFEAFLASLHAAPDQARRDAAAAAHGLTFPR